MSGLLHEVETGHKAHNRYFHLYENQNSQKMSLMIKSELWLPRGY